MSHILDINSYYGDVDNNNNNNNNSENKKW